MKKVAQPHDAYVRGALGDIALAKQFLEAYLPTLSAALRTAQLVIKDDSYVDTSLEGVETDLLFEISLRDARVMPYVLLEHKATAERFARVQVLKYVVKILTEEQEKLRPGQIHLPAVVPIVLHQGPRPWEFSTELDELLVPEQFRGYVRLKHELVDLAKIEDGSFPGDARLRTFLRLLKYARRYDLPERLPYVLADFAALPEADRKRAVAYISSSPILVTQQQLRQALDQVTSGEGGAHMATIADEYILEGMVRKSAELRPVILEAQRLVVEAQNKADAAERSAAEVKTRAEQEAAAAAEAKLRAEEARLKAEQGKLKAEQDKLKAEDDRLKAEEAAAAAEHRAAQAEWEARGALAEALVEMLQAKFSAISEAVRERIVSANSATLRVWLKKVHQAATPEAVVIAADKRDRAGDVGGGPVPT